MNKNTDFYNLFLNNKLSRKEFTVEFEDGNKVTGIPTCGSMVDPKKEILFELKYEDESGNKVVDKYPINSVSSATPK